MDMVPTIKMEKEKKSRKPVPYGTGASSLNSSLYDRALVQLKRNYFCISYVLSSWFCMIGKCNK